MLIRSIKSTSKTLFNSTPSTSTLPKLIQPFSSTSHKAFFFNKPPPNQKQILDDLATAIKSDRLDLVSSLYPSLSKSLNGSSSSSSSSSIDLSSTETHERLQELMSFVARTSRFTLLLRIFDDLPKFGFLHDLKDHVILLKGMANTGRSLKGIKWLESMETTWGVRPRTREWNIIIDGFRKEQNEEGMRRVLIRMEELKFIPNIGTYNTLISGLFELGNIEGVREIRAEMERKNLEPTLFTYTSLLTGFTRAGEMASAKAPAEALRTLVREWSDKESMDTSVLNALIKQEIAKSGIEAGISLAESYQSSGFRLDRYSLNTLVKEASKDVATMEEGVELLDRLESVLGVSSDRRSWTMVLKGILNNSRGSIPEAMKIYQEARDRSIAVDSSMIQPLLTALLEPTPSPETFKVAKELYEDISTSSRSYSTGPDAGIYITLLKACANKDASDLDFSRSLIQDMRERSIKLDGKIVSWHIIALMRAADSFESAFESYDAIRALDVGVLDTKAYNSILSVFTNLLFPPRALGFLPPSAPPPLILEFLSDMRRTQNPPDVYTYTLLLSYYSRSESSSASSIAHIHSLIKLDINLDPDTILFNSLMMAYSRVGAFVASFRIWDTMRVNHTVGQAGGVDNTSVSIIIDNGTWEMERNLKTLKITEAGTKLLNSNSTLTSTSTSTSTSSNIKKSDTVPTLLTRTEMIWNELQEEGFELNLKNYETCLEYLCRSNRFQEAEELVFEIMSPPTYTSTELRNRKKIIIPIAEKSTIETLLKFSRRFEGKFVQVKERIRLERPEIWEEVKDVARWIQDKPDIDFIELRNRKLNRDREEEEVESIARY